MKNLTSQLGIQSYCFRGFKTLGEVLPRLKACGVHLPGDMFEGVTEIR